MDRKELEDIYNRAVDAAIVDASKIGMENGLTAGTVQALTAALVKQYLIEALLTAINSKWN